MTREEAIEMLNKWGVLFPSEASEAVDMAIETLSAEPNMIPIKLEKRYPESRDEDITDAFMQGYLKGKADRPQGEWIPHTIAVGDKEYIEYSRCSECGEIAIVHINFCPNCGSDNRGDNNE